ncbi:MAG: 30S ribosome-binding factor RbfA [Candidatus Gastranaerophilaceae bacterium]|jgi:ribosome-binding factor A
MFSRGDRIRKMLMKELSDILLRSVKDPRIAGIVSITDLELSPDYSIANIYISVYGSENQKEQTMDALIDNTSKIRREIGKRIRLRLTPELHFFPDDSLERGSRITQLLDKISKGEV